MHAGFLEMLNRLHHIFDIAAGLPLAALDDTDLRIERKVAGILGMARGRRDRSASSTGAALAVEQAYRPHRFEIDVGDLLALAQIGDGLVSAPSVTRNAMPLQAPPRSRPSTSPGSAWVPRCTME